jgi:hypothetical protein
LTNGLAHIFIAKSGFRGLPDPERGSAATSYKTKAQTGASDVNSLELGTLNTNSFSELRNVFVAVLEILDDSICETKFTGT